MTGFSPATKTRPALLGGYGRRRCIPMSETFGPNNGSSKCVKRNRPRISGAIPSCLRRSSMDASRYGSQVLGILATRTGCSGRASKAACNTASRNGRTRDRRNSSARTFPRRPFFIRPSGCPLVGRSWLKFG